MEDRQELIAVVARKELVTDAKFHEKRIYILRLYAGLISFVEIAKQACVPMYSSMSLTTLSNAPPQDSLLQANFP